MGLCVLYTRSHSQVLTTLWKVKRLGAFITSEGRMFHNAGASAEKVLFLDSASQKSLIDMVCSILPCLNKWDGVM